MTGLVTSVGHTGVTVSDLDRAISFYRDILGLPVSAKISASGPMMDSITGIQGVDFVVSYVRAPGHVIELACHRKPDDRTHSRLRMCDAGAVHIALKVKDIDHVVLAVRRGGFETLGPIQTIPEGPLKDLRVVFVKDPDGILLELIEEPPGLFMEELYLTGSSTGAIPSSVSPSAASPSGPAGGR